MTAVKLSFFMPISTIVDCPNSLMALNCVEFSAMLQTKKARGLFFNPKERKKNEKI